MKLGTKIALILATLVSVVLAVLGAAAVARNQRFLEADTTHDQRVVATVLVADLEERMSAGDSARELAALPQAIGRREKQFQVRWGFLDADPERSVPSAKPDVWARVRAGGSATFHSGESEPEQWTVVPGHAPDGRRFFVAVGESLREEHAHLVASLLWTAATIALLALAGSIAIVLTTRRLVTRPVRALVEHARAVAEGDLERRLVVGQRDEIGELAAEMNAMSGELRRSREELDLETQRRIASVEQLRHADRLTTVGRLASGLAHELGTPLNVVQGYGRLIAQREDVDEEVKESARTIVGQTEKMTHLVRQLLDFARRKTPKTDRVDLADLATRVATVLAPTARAKSVGLEASADGPVWVRADATMIEQVLTNLVFNALQASPAGAAPISVAVDVVDGVPDAATPNGRYAHVEVRDHGKGIAPDDLSRIFEPFFTTKDVGEGTGLGLSVAHTIVQDHHGYLRVGSELEKGTAFQVYLPLEPNAATA